MRTHLTGCKSRAVALGPNALPVKLNIPVFMPHIVIFRLQEHQQITQEDATGPGSSFLKHQLLPARGGGQALLGVVGNSDTAKVWQYFSVYSAIHTVIDHSIWIWGFLRRHLFGFKDHRIHRTYLSCFIVFFLPADYRALPRALLTLYYHAWHGSFPSFTQ